MQGNNRIAITGGSGFMGTNIVQYYIDRGWNVVNFSHSKPKNHVQLDQWKDISILNYNKLKESILDFDPIYIIHLAGRTDLNGSSIEDYKANTVGTFNILLVAKECKNLKKIIITSSQMVCRPGYHPRNQKDYSPTTLYGKSKVLTENIVWDNQPQCDWSIIRPTSIWGPWFRGSYYHFFKSILDGKYFHFRKINSNKTFGYIFNAVYQIDSILNADTMDYCNKVFYIGDYEPYNVSEWADEIANSIGKRITLFPYWVAKSGALFGDLLSLIGIGFPLTSKRLANMLMDNISELSQTKELAPILPKSRIDGIKETSAWIKANN